MADGISITAPAVPDDELHGINVPANIYNMDVNYTAQNQWFAYFPVESILGQKYANINLHLTRFSLPQLEMGSMTTSYKGYEKSMPTKVLNSGTKQLTLEYIVDDQWKNYKAMYAWISKIHGTLNPIANTDGQSIQPSDYLPLRIYLMDNYKKKIIQFFFENTWLHIFNDIALDVANSDIVTHSITVDYDQYHIEDI